MPPLDVGLMARVEGGMDQKGCVHGCRCHLWKLVVVSRCGGMSGKGLGLVVDATLGSLLMARDDGRMR